MTEQDRFEAYIRSNSKLRSIEKYHETGEYVDPFVSILYQGWQAAIESREPAKDVDMEALKRGQENAEKIWTPEAVAEVLGTAKELK